MPSKLLPLGNEQNIKSVDKLEMGALSRRLMYTDIMF